MSWLPNSITIGRILAAPGVPILALSSANAERYYACGLFVVLALSDAVDGHFARKWNTVSNLGRLIDPVADKVLLIATFLPLYVISRRGPESELLPWWGEFPSWALLAILGRELLVTCFRVYSVKSGVVISAEWSGKWKMFLQSAFCGAALLWYPLATTAAERGWESGNPWERWSTVHEAAVALTLAAAIALTLYSMAHYLWSYRSLFRQQR